MPRSASYERAWLEAVARSAGRWTELDTVQRFFDEVRERLAKGEREYEAQPWHERPLLELIREAREEAADEPAWLVLAAQRLNDLAGEGAVNADTLYLIQERLVRAAALSLLAHEELAAAAQDFRTANAESKWLAHTT